MLQQGSQDWHDIRKNYIGASDCPVIMGVSPWKTPFQLWQEKLGMIDDVQVNSAMKRGLLLENEARQRVSEMLEANLHPEVIFSLGHPFMMASLDGIDVDRKYMVEIKCPGKEDHNSACEGIIPEKYIPQLQHQMIVAELGFAYYFSYSPGSEIPEVLIRVDKNEKLCEKIIKEERKFWDCVNNLTPPTLTENDYVEKKDDLWQTYSSLYLESCEKLKIIEDEKEFFKQKLIEMCEGKNSKGCGVKVSHIVRPGSIDYNDIEELKTVDLNKYRKDPIKYWKITND